MGADFADGERVTVLDLMAEAAASTPGPPPVGPPPGPMSEAAEPAAGQRAAGGGPEELIERVERLSGELEGISDAHARGVAEELMASVLELYGAGLARVMELVEKAGPDGAGIRDALVEDGVVASLLLIHDLYPVSLEERVAEGLASVQPYMESHGGGVELLGLEGGVARLRLQGSCDGCAASSATLELAIKKALIEAAPDLVGMEVEGAVEPRAANGELSGTPLPLAPAVPRPTRLAPEGPDPAGSVGPVSGWLDVDEVAGLPAGSHTALSVGGTELLVANVNETLLAYLDVCAACGSSFEGGALDAGILTCPSCAARFDLPRAGRSADEAALQLGPVPLLREGATRVRVALTA
jgi:Fe-S cluster biogenesis protein NfuA/nitrite reductase/ring-hydroxylating ferredoxin subunit